MDFVFHLYEEPTYLVIYVLSSKAATSRATAEEAFQMGTIACDVTFTTPQGVFINAAHMSYGTLAELSSIALDEGDSRATWDVYEGDQWVTLTTDCRAVYRFDYDELNRALECLGIRKAVWATI